MDDAGMRRNELRGGIAIFVVAAALAVFFMGSTLLTPLYSIYEKAFGFSKIVLTLVYASYVVGNLGALLFFGRLSDQIGRRPVILSALLITAVSAFGFLFANGLASLFWARMLSGFANGVGSGTATAWIAELYGEDRRAHAAVVATGANEAGLAAGPLLAGLLTQYAPWPLHLSFVAYLLLLAVIMVLTWRTGETVQKQSPGLHDVSLRPRIGVPRELRARFIAPAVTMFVAMALLGFYAALIPSILIEHLHEANRAVGGAVVFELFLVGAVTAFLTQRLKSRVAMVTGLILLMPGVALLVLAELQVSLPILAVGTFFSGVSVALGFRGGLQVVNEIAPEDRRAELVSSFYIAGFSGNALPVIGVGVLATLAGSMIAAIVFAATLAVLAMAALITSTKYADAGRVKPCNI